MLFGRGDQGIHHTYLTAEGAKAPVEPAKMALGRIRGDAVRLGPVTETVALAEGIDIGLSIATACPELTVWAALSTEGL